MEKPYTTSVYLTDSELILLDGKCSEKVQAEVEKAKTRFETVCKFGDLPEHHAKLLGNVLSEAREKGVLGWRSHRITNCYCCGRHDGYFLVQRTTKRKRKGEIDYDKPKFFDGVDLRESSVVMTGHISLGGCRECVDAIIPHVLREIEGEKIQLPRAMTGEIDPKYRRVYIHTCKKCGWEGPETEMGKLPTLMGDGHYYGKCPKCEAENQPFGGMVVAADYNRQVVVDNPDYRPILHLTQGEFDALTESWDYPKPTTYGTRWKRRNNKRRGTEWLVGEYYDIGSDTDIGVRWHWVKVEHDQNPKPQVQPEDLF